MLPLVILGFLMKSNIIFKTYEYLTPPTVTDRVEAARNHLIWSMEWKGERVGIVEMRRHYTQLLQRDSWFQRIQTKN